MTSGKGDLFGSGSQSGYDRYNQGLSDAITSRDWVYDPSFAIRSDHAIWLKIQRDPVAAHAIRFRKHLVAGTDWTVNPATDSDEDKAAAEVSHEAMSLIQGFTDARINQADAIFRGSSYSFVSGSRKLLSLGGGPERWWWVPERLIQVDRRRFRLVRDWQNRCLKWQFWSVEGRAWQDLDNPEWFCRSVFSDTEDTLGYGRGLLDTLYYFQAGKARVLRDAMRCSERFGSGFIKVAIDNARGADGRPAAAKGRDGDSVATAWRRTLKKQAAEDFLCHDKRDEVEIVQGFGEGFGLLKSLIDYYDASQVMTVLGAVVNTMKPEGGSFALAAEQANSTETLVQADRKRMSDDITRDVLGLFWRLNRFNLSEQVGACRPPRFEIVQRRNNDPYQSAETIDRLLRAGISLRREDVYDRIGFSQPAPGDEVFEGIADAPNPLLQLSDPGAFSASLAALQQRLG